MFLSHTFLLDQIEDISHIETSKQKDIHMLLNLKCLHIHMY